ncbi:hypothetical protein QVD17_42337 [Tagetes erecta]|uniref:DUF4283 domain-containing protein n=1 Tax=Tagetes erecta TaxID=13708 RepID=A0AAD8JLS4_TARER|nr:hypothetical protein QVD17_42337 [Tagetes erecta]
MAALAAPPSAPGDPPAPKPSFASILAGTSSSSPAVTKAPVKPILPDILLLNNPLLSMVLPFSPIEISKASASFNTTLIAKRSPNFNPKYEYPITAAWVRADQRTLELTHPMYALVCMEVDISQPLPSKVWIGTGKDEGFYQKMVFEGKLAFCHHCNLQGHSPTECRKALAKKTKVPSFLMGIIIPNPFYLSVEPLPTVTTHTSITAKALSSFRETSPLSLLRLENRNKDLLFPTYRTSSLSLPYCFRLANLRSRKSSEKG